MTDTSTRSSDLSAVPVPPEQTSKQARAAERRHAATPTEAAQAWADASAFDKESVRRLGHIRSWVAAAALLLEPVSLDACINLWASMEDTTQFSQVLDNYRY